MFSRDRLITGIISRKLDENWPNLVVNLLFANGWNTRKPVVCRSAVRSLVRFCPTVYLSSCRLGLSEFIYPVHLSVSLSVCLPLCLFASLSVCLFASVCLPLCLSVCFCLSVCLSATLSVCLCLSVYLSICLSVRLFLCISVLFKQLSVSFSKY